MPQFVKQIKTLNHSKHSLYFDQLNCEETRQNELSILWGKQCLYCVTKARVLKWCPFHLLPLN